MTTWIAEESVVFVHPDGTRTTGRIALGMPFRREDYCVCDASLEGMERALEIHGESTLQALMLASRHLGMRLHDFLSRGGRVVYPPNVAEDDDTDVPLSALFAELLRAPESVSLPDDEALGSA